MRVAFAGGNGYPPEAAGGVQSSTHHLARGLLARGHAPAVLAPLYGAGWFGLKARARLKLGGGGLVADRAQGYPVHRAWFPQAQVGAFVRAVRPDVAVVQCHGTVPLARAFAAEGVALVIYLRNVEFHELGGDLTGLPGARFIANSAFTARTYRDRFGIKARVIPPTIDRAAYAVTPEGPFVTFIGPVPEKGLDLALQVAALCPEIPFLFVESWHLAAEALAALERRLASLPNVTFRRRTPDMPGLVRQTRVLLAPSRWEEAWGRVASEAQCSGIPVLGSSRGGLPEAIGPGGLVLDAEAPAADWAEALRGVWADPDRHAALSAAALAHAARPEMDPDRQFAAFLAEVEAAAGLRQAA
jgi:glycosyltransferase involved in cell wall biosynthesis